MAGKPYTLRQVGLMDERYYKWSGFGWTLNQCVRDLMRLKAFKGRTEYAIRDKLRRMFNLK